MAISDKFRQALTEELARIKQESFKATYQATDAEAFGLMTAHFFAWDGVDIMQAAGYVLEHANFHAEAGQLTGRGASQAAALADLGSQLAAMASRAQEAPAFWWDADNRVLWVTVPDVVSGGCTAYPVHLDGEVPTTSGGVSSYAAGASEAMARSVGIVPVGPPARRRPVDPELYARTAPAWTCVSAPDGPHYLSPGPTPPRGSCQWCGAPAAEIRQQAS